MSERFNMIAALCETYKRMYYVHASKHVKKV